ncbi:hypothetical protein BCL79_0776 [Stenotrophomonas rhizophila]|uniref:DUF560 domain-containing protein n=1 Tax=Stenotrophomonas rhizophila TaxID=216778 RepID=A0A498CIX4_9GAMM|nr:hypothetical protein BCL79_0776 [Stenotrophomonas rhizophila]
MCSVGGLLSCLSDQVNVFNESQSLKGTQKSGLAHTFGMDFYPAVGGNMGVSLGDSELDTRDGGRVDRKSVSLFGGRASPDTDWQSKLEWRRDAGAERRTRWVSANHLSHKINESWRIAGRFHYADTDDVLNPIASASFIEGNLGLAYRPWNGDRWGCLGAIPTCMTCRRWAKSKAWTTISAPKCCCWNRYGLAEYRWLDVRDGGQREGWMAGLDRDVTRSMRVGVGYNFTRFSDDLTDFDYDHRGYYLNLVGRY